MNETKPAVDDAASTSTGSLRAIWVKRFHGGPMDAVESGTLVAGKGLAGDANFGSKREVTLIHWERWQEAQANLGTAVDPSARRANLLLSGVSLHDSRGRVLRVGGARLRILGETRPCNLMDEAEPGLRIELQRDWGGGAWAEVLDGGVIRSGDGAAWE